MELGEGRFLTVEVCLHLHRSPGLFKFCLHVGGERIICEEIKCYHRQAVGTVKCCFFGAG